MIDKIRINAAGYLSADYHAALRYGHDRVLCAFLRIAYVRLREHILDHPRATEQELLEWTYAHSRRLEEIDRLVVNGFLGQRG
jgi:hypothetical protein